MILIDAPAQVQVDSLTHPSQIATIVSCCIAFISLSITIYTLWATRNDRETNRNERHKLDVLRGILLGFMHGIKPLVESAANGSQVPPSAWKAQLDQIHDMMTRLQASHK